MTRRRVVLWRHGRTTWNADGRFQGQTDVDLDDEGRAQALDAARRLATLRPDLIVSSDLRRARDTAQALADLTGLQVEVDPALRETDTGRWKGLLGSEVAERFAEDYARWRTGDPAVRAGGGETRVEVARRVAAAVESAVERLSEGGLVVLATHGGGARVAIGSLLDLPLARWHALGALSNAAWSLLERRSDGWVLVEHNAGTLPEPVEVDEG